MPKRTDISLILALGGAAALAGCATNSWAQMEEEFPEVRMNCGLVRTYLERDPDDERGLRLIFPQRNNAAMQARAEGSLACVEHWAAERGYTLTTGGV